MEITYITIVFFSSFTSSRRSLLLAVVYFYMWKWALQSAASKANVPYGTNDQNAALFKNFKKDYLFFNHFNHKFLFKNNFKKLLAWLATLPYPTSLIRGICLARLVLCTPLASIENLELNVVYKALIPIFSCKMKFIMEILANLAILFIH